MTNISDNLTGAEPRYHGILPSGIPIRNIAMLMRGLDANYAKTLSDQVRRGMLARAKAGLPIGTIPLGYKTLGKKVKIVEPTARHIRNAFRWIDKEGMHVRTAWRRATALGLLSRRGKPLSMPAFQFIVSNPFYAGFIRYGDELYEGVHTPLVPEEIFWRVQEKLDRSETCS